MLKYAQRYRLLDIPNDRSSHTLPTPRGGGVGIVISFIFFYILMNLHNGVFDIKFFFAVTASIIVAITGFIDDHSHIAAKWRLMIHFICATWSVYWIGSLSSLYIYGYELQLAWLGYIFSVFYLVWLLNLYNFMDGIDGIASVQAITSCLGGILILILMNAEPYHYTPLLLLMVTTLGFLFWNFPPAKIFMGDAGSGFIGFTLGICSLQAVMIAQHLFWSWLILLGIFITDATVTLIRRLLRGNMPNQAHRNHAYQYASRKFNSHKYVSLAVTAINLIWLLPLALIVAARWIDGFIGLLIAYIPLIYLALRFKSGAHELQEY